MRKLVYYVGISLDGYIAGPNGEIDFYPVSEEFMGWMGRNYPETLPTHVRRHVGFDDAPNQAFDTLVMGLGTYRPALDAGIASPYGHVKQYIVSTSLEKIDDPAVTLVRDPLPLVRELKQQDGLDVWLAGGGKLAGALLPEIDRLVFKSYPVMAGSGVSAVSGEFQPTQFTVTERLSFDNGATVTWFDRL
ncbi:dihydrofolate reductase family protein [Kibdelosporangium phytohabitans]|uniref:Deaminase n=1 Tax=Kibdelosporangium phytohabitans TaxID=860235 RepID=A0A0N9HUC9_9PSEU|nr:dihydrofolate reductase family protein [Kibdelosporangium phytohabitans]ALG10885.1 deaminase [Kibdelosporangium phytohabitans]MBE1462073.1 dihydrofolate reductase [Kibdelosporangium phytohabitans]